MDSKWNIPGKANNLIDVLRYIAKQRDFSKQQIKDFISTVQKPHDPYLFPDMENVVKRIKHAIENNETICIIGDYDADGVTSTYTMFRGLKQLGANVIYKLPHRIHNGYGLKRPLVDFANENDSKLIITVDNGIAAIDAIEYAKELGIEVIVTDHHEPGEILPDCLIINPKVSSEYPFDGLCGCGVAFKVICALHDNFEGTELYNHLIEIVAIGTIADAMAIVDENRTFIIEGLKRMENTSVVGLRELFFESGKEEIKVDVDTVGFFIGPNINACGRIDTPEIALNLLLSDDAVTGKSFATKLLKLNELRKEMQATALSELKIDENDAIIVEKIDSKYAGIGGIIASNIVDLYKRPCFIFHDSETSETIGGSGRTYGEYEVINCIKNNRDIVVSGGGHKGACGVAVKKENLKLFKERCNEQYKLWCNNNPEGLVPTINATCEIGFDLATERLINNIEKLKPYGEGNPEPVFYTSCVDVINCKIVGKNKNVIQMNLSKNFKDIKAVGFNKILTKFNEMGCPNKIDILYTIALNEFPEGHFTVQAIIQDIRETNSYY